jgi:hypothetical protein
VRWGNESLLQSLRDGRTDTLLISSYGFRFLLLPVLQQMNLPPFRLDACGFWMGMRDRATEKHERLIQHLLPQDTLRLSLLVTDSRDDETLAEQVAASFFLRWMSVKTEAIFICYIPFYYLVKIKCLGWRFVRSVLIFDEYVLLALCYSMVQPIFLAHVAGVFLLLLSFWIIYEVGYMENDIVAERFEVDPVLNELYTKNKNRICFVEPWFWAVTLAAPGVTLVQWGNGNPVFAQWWEEGIFSRTPTAADFFMPFSVWILVLIVLRLVYYGYNHVDKLSRVWIYLPLQLLKSFGFLAVSTSTPAGIVAMISQALGRWVVYLVYRVSRLPFLGTPAAHIIRLIIYAVCIGGLALVDWEWMQPHLVQVSAILVWFLFRARRILWDTGRQVKRVSQDNWTANKAVGPS